MHTNQSLNEAHQKKLLQYFERDLVFFDLETTGLSPSVHHIIEIGAVKLSQKGEFTTFQSLVKPPIPIPERSEKIHGISDNDVSQADNIKDVMARFFEFIVDCDLVAHNAMFDIGFMIKEAQILKMRLPKVNVFDSLKFTRDLLAKIENRPENFKLSTLAGYINFDYQSHRAFDDSLATVFIWSHCVQVTESESVIKEACNKSLIFTTKKVKAYNDKHSHYKLLSELCSDDKKCVIIYNGGSRRGKERPLKPIAIIPLPNKVCLYAHCVLDDIHKTFSLDKIQNVRALTAIEEEEYGA